MSNKKFKILSIDGGGIKGLYSARILQQFEASLQKEHDDENLRIVDYFDLVCGTSTGGLIALAISLRKPMDEVCSFYEEHGAKIFPSSERFYRKAMQIFFGGKYSDKYLKKVCGDFYGEHTLGDSHSLLCIPSYDLTHGTYALFRYDHKEGNLSKHNKLTYLDVALSTSAAPTYFPLAQIKDDDNKQYVDGGVWANNPSLIGFTEAIRYFVGEDKAYDSMQILSIASLDTNNGKPPMMKRERSFKDWTDELFEMGLTGQSEFTDVFLGAMMKETKFPLDYVRVSSGTVSSEHEKYITLDNASEESINLINQYGKDQFHYCKEDQVIKDIFSTKKTYFIK